MRMVSSPGKSIRRRREICPGLHALAHRRCCRRPCRRPFQATAGPTTAAPPGVATAPDRRSCTYVRRAAVVASLALFGRRAARSACHCAVVARYAKPPLRVAALRRNSREIVDGARLSWRAISRMPWPRARHSAISSRSANTRYRSDGGFADGASVVGGMPPASRNQRPPTAGDTPASIAAASLDRPAAGSPAAPRLVGQATPATRLVAPDPSAVSQPSSQPPPSRCCDDNLNPPFARYPFLVKLYADGGYQGPQFRRAIKKILRRVNLEIVKRSDQAKGFVVLPKRWIVERTIAWLNRCRRLAKDWENLNCKALAFLRLASIRLMLRRLCNPA